MTLSRMVKPLIGMVMVPIVLWAMWVAVTDVYSGANPAFVPAASSQQVVSTKGFNRGENK